MVTANQEKVLLPHIGTDRLIPTMNHLQFSQGTTRVTLNIVSIVRMLLTRVLVVIPNPFVSNDQRGPPPLTIPGSQRHTNPKEAEMFQIATDVATKVEEVQDEEEALC